MLAQPCILATSRNTIKCSSVIWSVEHPPSLQRFGGSKPKALYEMGEWKGEYKPLVAMSCKPMGEQGVELDVSVVTGDDFLLDTLRESPTMRES